MPIRRFLALALLFVGLSSCMPTPEVAPATRPVGTRDVPTTTAPPTTTAELAPSATPVAATTTTDPAVTLEAFLTQLQRQLNERQFDDLNDEIATPFVTGIYPIATLQTGPRAILPHLHSRLLPPEPAVSMQVVDASALALPQELTPAVLFPERAAGVTLVSSSGWGMGGSNQALLYFVEEEGQPRWAGLVLGYEGQAVEKELATIPPPPGLVYHINHEGYTWWQVNPAGEPELLSTHGGELSFNREGTLALLTYREAESVRVMELPQGNVREFELDGRLISAGWRVQWLDEETVALLITNEPMVTQGTTGHLALLNTTTGQLTRLVDGLSIYNQFSVTRPGTLVYGVSEAQELLIWRDGELTTMPVAGLQNATHLSYPVLTPDGTYVAGLGSTGQGLPLAGYYVAGVGQAQNTLVHAYAFRPTDAVLPRGIRWSPDSQWLALGAEGWDLVDDGVMLVTPDGSEKVYLGPSSLSPVWLDGQRVVYTGVLDGVVGLQLYDLATGEHYWLDTPRFTAGLREAFWVQTDGMIEAVQFLPTYSD